MVVTPSGISILSKLLQPRKALFSIVFKLVIPLYVSNVTVSKLLQPKNAFAPIVSNVEGNTECYGHVECDAIIQDNGHVHAIPEINAKNIDANLVHEATIGKIAGEQLIKLMSLGLSSEEAEMQIINGFLK